MTHDVQKKPDQQQSPLKTSGDSCWWHCIKKKKEEEETPNLFPLMVNQRKMLASSKFTTFKLIGGTTQTHCFPVWHHKKKISQQFWFIFSTISRCLKVSNSSVKTTIRKYVSSHHTALEGDMFCVPEMNVVWSETCNSTPEQKSRHLVKMLAETNVTWVWSRFAGSNNGGVTLQVGPEHFTKQMASWWKKIMWPIANVDGPVSKKHLIKTRA